VASGRKERRRKKTVHREKENEGKGEHWRKKRKKRGEWLLQKSIPKRKRSKQPNNTNWGGKGDEEGGQKCGGTVSGLDEPPIGGEGKGGGKKRQELMIP